MTDKTEDQTTFDGAGEAPETEEKAPLSLRDAIGSALEGKAPADEYEEASDGAETPEEPEETAEDETGGLMQGTGERLPPRDPDDKRKKDPLADKRPFAAAPQRWGPEAREHWDKLPNAVKTEVANRERYIEHQLQQGAQARRAGTAVNEIANRFAPLLAAENISDPIQAFQGLMQVTAQLHFGTPQQKAERVAHLIQHYGVDVNVLDQMLVGETPEVPQEQLIAQHVQQAVAPFQQAAMQQHQFAQQQQAQRVDGEIANFAKDKEFFEDVRPMMADLMELAARRNEELSFDEAYHRACAAHPGVAATLQQRQQELEAKRAAGGSLPGRNPGPGVNGGAEDTSIRGSLLRAFEQ